MDKKEKIALLTDLLELEENSIDENTPLSSIEEYDSLAKLSLIVLMDEEFNKKLTGEKILEFVKVKDILDFMDE